MNHCCVSLGQNHQYAVDNEPVWQRQQQTPFNGSVTDSSYGPDLDSGAQLEFFTHQQVNGEHFWLRKVIFCNNLGQAVNRHLVINKADGALGL
jgi:hypothetical protein